MPNKKIEKYFRVAAKTSPVKEDEMRAMTRCLTAVLILLAAGCSQGSKQGAESKSVQPASHTFADLKTKVLKEVKKGMTEQQLLSLLGKPDQTYPKNGTPETRVIYAYQPTDVPIVSYHVEIVKGVVESVGGLQTDGGGPDLGVPTHSR